MKTLNLKFQSDSLKILLDDNNFVNRWTNLMQEHIDHVPSKHTYQLTLSGFNPGKEFNLLKQVILKVNEHRLNTIPKQYIKDEYTMTELSEIHYIYEEIGQDPNWLNGNLSYNEAISYRDLLNDKIHQAESYAMGKNRSLPRIRFRTVDPSTGVPNARKVEFEDGDYNLFDPIIKPYTVYLNYNAVGEDFIKTFKSGRTPDTAIPLQKYSPSFFFVLEGPNLVRQMKIINDCKHWMLKHGFDPNNKYNSFGYLPLGIIFKERNDDYYKSLLQENLEKINILKTLV